MKKALIMPLLLLAGCTARVPEKFSTMDFGIGSTLVFSGPGRDLVLEEDAETHEYGRDYRITLIIDGGTAAQVALSLNDNKDQWSLTPQYWDKKNRAVVDIDGRPYPLVDAWQKLSRLDERFVMISIQGQRCGTGAALSADGCAEQNFYLRTSTGIIKGPFIRPEGGAQLSVGAEYAVARPRKAQLEYQQLLEHIILPDVDFRRVKADEAISFLDDEFRRLAPKQYLPINVGPQCYLPVDDNDEPYKNLALPAVSWTATGISLLDALEITCTIAKLQFYIQDNMIVVSQ
ncbi:hypothetical protein ACFLQU_01545 [Verrucomicrobiota bacterium]